MDEGASMLIMSITSWKGLSSLTLIPSPKMLKPFDKHTFYPHGIIPSFSIELGGKTVEIKVKVVDIPLEYNLVLDHSWTYAMEVVVSSFYKVIKFSH